MAEPSGRRFTDEEFMALRDKFYDHMRDEEIKTVRYEIDRKRISEQLKKIQEDIAPILQEERDTVGFYRKGTKLQVATRYILFWPLAAMGLFKTIAWLQKHLPHILGGST